MKLVCKAGLQPILPVQTAVDVFLSVLLTSGGLHGQPVWGGEELQRRPTPTRPKPLVQPLLQPLLQPGCAAGREPQVARLWPLHIHGEGYYLIRKQWVGSGWGFFLFVAFVKFPPTRLFLWNKADYEMMNRFIWQLLLLGSDLLNVKIKLSM